MQYSGGMCGQYISFLDPRITVEEFLVKTVNFWTHALQTLVCKGDFHTRACYCHFSTMTYAVIIEYCLGSMLGRMCDV